MPADKSQIFSQEALDKLRSPERLDTMLAITTPVTWVVLVAIPCAPCFPWCCVDLWRVHC